MITYEQKQFAYDHKLPALPYTMDDTWMTMLFNSRPDILRNLGLCAPIDVQHGLLKYTPGKRCVLDYTLRNSQEHNPRQLFGKLYRDERGAAIFERMMILWCNGMRGKMPRPLHYFSPLGLLLQCPAPGKPLAEMLTAVALPTALETTAQNLARLHTTKIAKLPTRQLMADHLTKYCRPHPDQLIKDLTVEHPNLSQQTAKILDTLTDTDILKNTPLRTVHNDLNLAHIYWDSGNTVFIDLDGLCLAHAELDLATLRVALSVYLSDQGQVLGEQFLEAYLAAGGIMTDDSLQLYESFVYLRRATICYRKRAHNSAWLQELTELLYKSLQALPI